MKKINGDIRETPKNKTATFKKSAANAIEEMLGNGTLSVSPKQPLHHYSHQVINILNSITDGFFMVDEKFHVTLWNHKAEKIFGVLKNKIVGKNIFRDLPEFKNLGIKEELINAFKKKNVFISEQHIHNMNLWFEINAYPSENGLFIYFKDINKRKSQEMLLELEKKVLEINSDKKATLKITIDYFLEGVEKIFPGMLCSILVLDDDAVTMRQLSAPSLPVEYSAAIDGEKIGPVAGSCGTAMFTKKRIIVDNIATNALWANYKELAQLFNLHACWSFPIINVQNEVLATFALYYQLPKSTSETELNFLDRAVNLCKIIIENKKAEEKIKISNERYILATRATNDVIWDWDLKSLWLFWSDSFYKQFGFKPGKKIKEKNFWESHIHPDERNKVVKELNKFIEKKGKGLWQQEYHFKKSNGKYVLIADRGFLVYDQDGNAIRMVGAMQDITEKKEMETKLLEQKISRQNQIMQAVVDTQEKERAEIGKELHDNVNQLLSTTKLNLELLKNKNEDWENVLSRSVKNINLAINEIRNISRSLVPSSIGDLGLVDAIGDLIENIKGTTGINIEFYPIGRVEDEISSQQKLMLFRIVQEQVNNVLKHSQAHNLIIELILINNRIELNISDDGKGFDLSKMKHRKGLGISNIISRAGLFGGKVSIVSAKGEGCKLSVQVPIHNL
jgi:PAS domain S-box-containing protein